MRAMIFIVVSPSMTSIRIPETAWALVNLISNSLAQSVAEIDRGVGCRHRRVRIGGVRFQAHHIDLARCMRTWKTTQDSPADRGGVLRVKREVKQWT